MKFFRNTPFLLAPLLLPGLLFPITVWERETWNGIIEKAAFSSDAKRVACAMAGGRLLVRDMETGEILFEESTQPNSICSVDISSDGQHVVWGDLSGMLYAWNPDDGTSSLTAGQMALSGLAVASDGSNVAVMGDGTQLRIRQVSDFQSVYFKNLNLEQVHALAVDTSGNYILAGDHSGRAALVNRSTGAAASKPITGVGLEGALFLSGAGSQAILWDAEGSLILVDSGLNVIGSVQLGGDTVNKVIQDIAGNRVVIATRSGAILGVNLADLKLDSSPIAALDQSAIGLGI